MTKLMPCAFGALLSGCLSLAPVWLGSDERPDAGMARDAATEGADADTRTTTTADARADSATSDAGEDGGDEADEADEADDGTDPDQGAE